MQQQGNPFPWGYFLANYHDVDTYHVPLIVSSGPDETLGLYEPGFIDVDANENGSVDPGEDGNGNGSFDNILGTLCQPIDPANLDPLTDNITNHNQRAGGN